MSNPTKLVSQPYVVIVMQMEPHSLYVWVLGPHPHPIGRNVQEGLRGVALLGMGFEISKGWAISSEGFFLMPPALI